MPMTAKPHRPVRPAPTQGAARAVIAWLALMAVGGFGFGLIGERRPFGTDVFAHPLVAFAITAAAALLLLRLALGRPVPQVIPDRSLLIGCFVGLAAFLAGNFVATHVGPLPF
jgi:drug/metabolite transporter (DMT)-like permease